MKNSAKLLYVGLVLLAIGAGGFTHLWGAKDWSLVEESSGTSPLIGCAVNVERGHVYEVSLSAVDSAGLPWNVVDVEATILFDGGVVYSDSFSASEFPGKAAREALSFRADVRQDGLLEVDGIMREGERWTVSIYRDLPPFLEVAPFACAVAGLLGLVCVVQSGEVS